MYTASQSTQTLEEDEDDDLYSTPLPLSRPLSGHLDAASLSRHAPLLNPELLVKLQREARKRSTSQARRREIATLLALCLQPDSPVSSPGESEREEEQLGDTGARYRQPFHSLSTHCPSLSIVKALEIVCLPTALQ